MSPAAAAEVKRILRIITLSIGSSMLVLNVLIIMALDGEHDRHGHPLNLTLQYAQAAIGAVLVAVGIGVWVAMARRAHG